MYFQLFNIPSKLASIKKVRTLVTLAERPKVGSRALSMLLNKKMIR